MLIDPMPKYDPAFTDDTNGFFRLLDLSPGRTVRRADSALAGIDGAHTATLTISHSASKENGAVPTDRSAVRLEVKKTTVEGKSVIAHVTLVAAFPAASFSASEMIAIWTALQEQMLVDSSGYFPANAGYSTSAPLNFERIIRGEP